MDVSVNKPFKDFMKRKLYTDEISKQMEGSADLNTVELDPVDLSLPLLKEKGAQWLVESVDYLSENPEIVANGFIKSGITSAIDGIQIDDCSDSNEEVDDTDESDGELQ